MWPKTEKGQAKCLSLLLFAPLTSSAVRPTSWFRWIAPSRQNRKNAKITNVNIDGFIWLEDIVEKLWRKHHVDENEVEQVFDNSPHIRFVENGYREGENVYAALGQTNGGRYLIVFFVYKSSKQALIVSARDMTISERRQYGRS